MHALAVRGVVRGPSAVRRVRWVPCPVTVSLLALSAPGALGTVRCARCTGSAECAEA